MNLFATIIMTFGLTAIGCYFYARVKHDRNVQLRYQVNMLVRQLDEEKRRSSCLNRSIDRHLAESVVMLYECERLERRNVYLESVHAHRKNILAASMLQLATMIPVKGTMTVREGEMP